MLIVGSIFEDNSISQAFKPILQTELNELECDCGNFQRALVRNVLFIKTWKVDSNSCMTETI